VLAIELGAGRTRADQKIDPAAGFELHQTVGARVARGEPLVTVHAATPALAKAVEARVLQAFRLGASAPKPRKLVLERLR
jgi:thymidine phosphorylase